MVCYRIKIRFPVLLDKIVIAPLLLLRRIWYGYTFRRIPLVNSSKYAIVDVADYYVLSKYIWWTRKRNGSYQVLRFTEEGACFRPVFMHRDVMQLKLYSELGTQNAGLTNSPSELVIDHIDRDVSDNRRANLRFATMTQNSMNKCSRGGVSKYKGVIYRAHKKLWVARISVDGKRKYIKSCKSEIDAAKAYDAAAKKYYKEFAYLNFPPPQKPTGLKNIIRTAYRA